MIPLIGNVVDVDALAKTAAAALVAGIGITLLFSAAILGLTRYSDLRRDGRPLPAVAMLAMAAVALAGSVAAVAVGIIVMISD